MSEANPCIFFESNLDTPAQWRDALSPHLGAFTFIAGPECPDPEAVEVALLHKPPRNGLQAFTRLRAVISLSAGVNQFEAAEMPAGVMLARSVDSSLAQQMVSYAKAAVFRFHRRFHRYEQMSRAGVWRFEKPRLERQTSIGILGLGELGGSVATALAAEGFVLHGWSRSARTLPGVTSHSGADGLQRMARAVDILVNLLPLSSATAGILSYALFKHLRPGSFLINMGRGAHLVEPDLLRALEEGLIEAATLDVTSVEPLPSGHPFWANPAILITPHIAGITHPATAAPQVAENIRRALRGQRLLNQVDRPSQ